jgi:flotillin
MEFLQHLSQGSVVVLGVMTIVVAFIALLRIISNNYIKVAPNLAAVFYGRRRITKDGKEVGFRVVTGGSALKLPLVENVQFLPLNVFSIDLDVKGAPNKDGVQVDVKGVANVKILSDEASLMTACERFLGMPPAQIQGIAYKNLEGHLRAIIGRLTVEEIVSDRSKFNQEVLQEAAEDLRKIGMGIDVLTVSEIKDAYGYIESLGQKRTAEVKSQAKIGTANAERDANVLASTAMREGKQKENENLAMIAEAEKIRDVKKAQYEAEISQQQANTRMTGPLAEAQAKQKVVEQEVLVEKIRTQKETEVAEAEGLRKEKELIATVVKPADAKRQATILEAEAARQQTILAAEGHKQAAIATAEADKARREMEGAGEAAAVRARGEGEAAAIRARGDAEASAIRAKLLAEAEGLRAKLIAEAEGVEKKALAFAHLDQAGKTMLVLERLPEIVREFSSVMGAIAAPMGNIDKVVMIDGGSGGAGGNSMSRYAGTVPGVLFDLLQKADALGIDLSGLLQKAGIQFKDGAPAPPPAEETKTE